MWWPWVRFPHSTFQPNNSILNHQIKKRASGKFSEYKTTSIPLIRNRVLASVETELNFFCSVRQKLSVIGKAYCTTQRIVSQHLLLVNYSKSPYLF